MNSRFLATGKDITVGGASVHILRNKAEAVSIIINSDSGSGNRFAGKIISVPKFPARSPIPNLVGHWTMIHMYNGQSYIHDMNVTGQDTQSITGDGGHPAGQTHSFAWQIASGVVTQNKIMLTIKYTAGAAGTTMHMTGDISQNGLRIENGKWDDNFNGATREGTWRAIKD